MATTATARRAHRQRTVAPKATTPAEAPATTKPSFWTRVKTAAKKVGNAVTRAAKAVVQFVKPMTDKVVAVAQRLWVRGLRTLLRTVLLVMFAAAVVLGLTLAPISTFFTLVLTAGVLFAFAAGLNALEDREATSRAARIALQVLNAIAYFVRGAVYGFAGIMVLAMMSVSLSFSVFVVGSLIAAYYDSAFGVFLAFAASCILSGQWLLLMLDIVLFGIPSMRKAAPAAEVIDVPEYSEIRRKPDVHENVVRAQPQSAARPAGSFLRAKGTEELWGTEWDSAGYGDPDRRPNSPAEVDQNWADVWVNDKVCSACGTDKGAMRTKSHHRAGDGTTDAWLCSECYDHECEDDAIRFTGVSLKTRSVEVRLNQTGIENAPAFAASKADPTSFHWMESAWWRDRAGDEHPRERICLMDGLEVARIVHDYKRKVYRASVLGVVVKNGVKTSWEAAQAVAQDELNDESAAVRRHEDAAEEVVGEAPARQSKKG
jgi:hypothetical protein